MAQKLYEKATVQAAIAGGIFVLLAALATIWHARSELTSENKRIKQKLESVEDERNSLRIQIAPFQRLAAEDFPNIPEDERLDRLLETMEQMLAESRQVGSDILIKLGSIEEAIARGLTVRTGTSGKRVISDKAVEDAIDCFRAVPGYTVLIRVVSGDNEAFALAGQIKGIFEKAGWTVDEIGDWPGTEPTGLHFKCREQLHALTFEQASEKPVIFLAAGIGAILDDLGYKTTYIYWPYLQEKTMQVLVGSI